MILNIFILHAFNIARNMACKNPLESMLSLGTLYAKKSCDKKMATYVEKWMNF